MAHGPRSARSALRSAADAAGTLLLLPAFAAYRSRVVSFTAISQGLALIPGQLGFVLRRAWYARTLAACGRNFVVDFGAAIRTPRTRVGNDCYLGVYNWVGHVDLGDDFMSGSHVTILSGRRQHNFDRLDVPMRAQGGSLDRVTIGRDVWVGAGATISSDVQPHSIVASGSVVTKTFPPYSILGGVPARAIADRRDGASAGADAGDPHRAGERAQG